MTATTKIMSIAASIFWIFLIIFFASAVYSMKDIQFNLGQPQISTVGENELLFSFPLAVTNTGFYNLEHFNVSTSVFTNGSEVARGFTFIPVIADGQMINTTHNMILNVSDLLRTNEGLLFSDTELRVNETVSTSAAGAVPIQAFSYFSIPWGAPLHNLTLGTPELAAYNSTHLRVNVPFSFENHASFYLTGSVLARIYSNTNLLIGKGQTPIEASQHSPYYGNLELYIPNRTISKAYVEVIFATQFFKYGPMVINYGA